MNSRIIRWLTTYEAAKEAPPRMPANRGRAKRNRARPYGVSALVALLLGSSALAMAALVLFAPFVFVLVVCGLIAYESRGS
jgi:hypothetical protein